MNRFLAALGLLLIAVPAIADTTLKGPITIRPSLPYASGKVSSSGVATASFYAMDYGTCTWDATHDVGTCINLASAAAVAVAGRVIVPPGTYGLTTTVNVPGNVCIIGAGSTSNGSGGSSATGTGTGTVLKWIGSSAGRMAASISTTGQVMQPCMNDIAFNGNNGLAADGLHAASVYRFNFDRLSFIGGFNGGTIFYIGSDAAAGGGSQDGTFNGLYINNGGGSWTSNQLLLDAFIDSGGVHGNASFLSADEVFIGGDGTTTGFKCVGCDNTFIRGRVFNTHSSVDYTIAQSGGNLFPANGNHYEGSYTGPSYFRGTTSFGACVSYSTCSYNNEIIIDQTNATPQPTTETGAVGNHWKSNSGYAYGYSFIGKSAVQPALWIAGDYSIWGACELAAKANDASGTMYLCNSTTGSLLDFDSLAGDRFRLAWAGSNGAKNAVFQAPLAGTGKWNFADTLQLDVGTIGKGTHQTAAFDSATFGQFIATDEDYTNSSRGTLLLQYGSAAAGTLLGLNKASLGVLGATNSTGLLVYTNNAQRISFGTNNVIRAAFESGADHFLVGAGTAPALTSCGTDPAISGDDQAGEVTMGTGSPTGCVITFNVAYVSAPYCVVTWQATPLLSQSYVVSNTAITLTQTATSSDKVNYLCRGRVGG